MTNSTQQQTSEVYVLYTPSGAYAKKPNPPTAEAIKRAQFVDKTYKWSGK